MSKRLDLESLYRTDPQRACRLALRRARYEDRQWRAVKRKLPGGILGEVDRLLGTCGVEVIRGEWDGGYWGDAVAKYANVGDSYACTVLYDVRTGRYLVTSYGDWIEREERNGRYVA